MHFSPLLLVFFACLIGLVSSFEPYLSAPNTQEDCRAILHTCRSHHNCMRKCAHEVRQVKYNCGQGEEVHQLAYCMFYRHAK